MKQLLKEATLVGISFIIITYIIKYIVKTIIEKYDFLNNKLTRSDVFTWFLIGFLGHLSFEFIGLNKLYCLIGQACQSE